LVRDEQEEVHEKGLDVDIMEIPFSEEHSFHAWVRDCPLGKLKVINLH